MAESIINQSVNLLKCFSQSTSLSELKIIDSVRTYLSTYFHSYLYLGRYIINVIILMLGTFIYIKAEYLHIYATARRQFRVFKIDFAEYATNCTPAAVFCENRALFHGRLSNTLSFPTFYSMKKTSRRTVCQCFLHGE